MTNNQNAKIKIVTNDDKIFTLNYFSPELGLIRFLKPILYSYIDDEIEEDNWKNIINKYNDNNLKPNKLNQSIPLYGINSKTFKYLLDFTKKIHNFQDKNSDSDYGRFSYNLLRTSSDTFDNKLFQLDHRSE